MKRTIALTFGAFAYASASGDCLGETTSTGTGDWESAGTWDVAAASGDYVAVVDGSDVVTVTSNTARAYRLVVRPSGRVVISAGSKLTISTASVCTPSPTLAPTVSPTGSPTIAPTGSSGGGGGSGGDGGGSGDGGSGVSVDDALETVEVFGDSLNDLLDQLNDPSNSVEDVLEDFESEFDAFAETLKDTADGDAALNTVVGSTVGTLAGIISGVQSDPGEIIQFEAAGSAVVGVNQPDLSTATSGDVALVLTQSTAEILLPVMATSPATIQGWEANVVVVGLVGYLKEVNKDFDEFKQVSSVSSTTASFSEEQSTVDKWQIVFPIEASRKELGDDAEIECVSVTYEMVPLDTGKQTCTYTETATEATCLCDPQSDGDGDYSLNVVLGASLKTAGDGGDDSDGDVATYNGAECTAPAAALVAASLLLA